MAQHLEVLACVEQKGKTSLDERAGATMTISSHFFEQEHKNEW